MPRNRAKILAKVTKRNEVLHARAKENAFMPAF